MKIDGECKHEKPKNVQSQVTLRFLRVFLQSICSIHSVSLSRSFDAAFPFQMIDSANRAKPIDSVDFMRSSSRCEIRSVL